MMIQPKTNNHLSLPVLSEVEGINNHLAFGISTTVEESLQIRLFMQNKANFRKSQMNVTNLLTREYEKRTLGERGKKQSQTKPIKANKMPKQTQNKPNQTQPVVSLSNLFQRQKMLLRLTINARRNSSRYYADEIEAPNAYDDKAVELFGEFACLNFPEMTENTCFFKMDLIAYDHQTACRCQ